MTLLKEGSMLTTILLYVYIIVVILLVVNLVVQQWDSDPKKNSLVKYSDKFVKDVLNIFSKHIKK